MLKIVAGLVGELGQGAAPPPALDDSLDRDLGISSLERVELLLRIERAYGIRLPDSVMAEAVSPKPHAQGWQEMVRLRDAARDEIARSAGKPSDALRGATS